MAKNRESQRENDTKHHHHYLNHLRQDFDDELDMETTSSNRTTRFEPLPPQKDIRILRCFCGCSQLTYEQIETYAMMNVKGVVHNDDSNKLLKTFLKIGHRSDKSNALCLLECYECCDRILLDLDSHRDYLDDLIELCPTFLWEQKITTACEADTSDDIKRQLSEVLNALKMECLCNLEGDHDYARFRRELLRKIGK